MSTYNGRRGPNVSQYLRDLNTISPQDTTGADDSSNFNYGGGDDLTLFTNTEFFDFDSGQNMDFQAQAVKNDASTSTSPANAEIPSSATSVMGDLTTMDYMTGEFAFADLNGYQAAPPMNNYHDGAANFQPLQSHGSIYPNPAQAQQAQHSQPASGAQGPKRKAEADSAGGNHQLNLEEASRVAAEEDKRRRNTAASARFRVKKKQREQALEKSAKEASEKIGQLESRVSQLETENKWLKNLLVEKNEGHGEDITALWKEFTKHASKRTLEAKEAAKADR